MTVAELLEKSFFCDYLEVTIRENGEGLLKYSIIQASRELNRCGCVGSHFRTITERRRG